MENKEKAKEEAELYNSPGQKAQRLNEKAYLKSSEKKRINFEIEDKDESNFKALTSSRVDVAKTELGYNTTKGGYDTAADELDIFKNKPKCLLLESHMVLLEEIFETLDKYDDFILIREDYIFALRNNPEVKMFINKPAVQMPKSRKTLTFDEIL